MTRALPSEDEIRVHGLTVDVIVGILPHERETPQPVTVTIALGLDATRAALTGDLAASVDYAQVATEVGFILREGRFRLLETAALALCQWLLALLPGVTRVMVALRKPLALGGHGEPEVVLCRRRPRRAKGTRPRVVFAGDGVRLVLAGAKPRARAKPAPSPARCGDETAELALPTGRRLVVYRLR